ncbi:hypothetical protein F751_4480 [Auxenochlorella protothecoides]|uniref:Uncharacterized protein n=1 Tax=Auxenochlorella protothecoides TaxID=3075 RepID=A0A087SNA6_AUXPR|nr:hypothetical protein F751_4480 [Auxenochlorella protothecoides]KFM27210.1 hypothetical protein F751_4480 [Auxenochlorella protothecoides]
MDEASDFGAGERVPKLDLSTVDLGTSLQQALGRADAVLMELKTLRCRAHAAKPKVAPQRNQVFHPKPPVAKPAIPSNSTPAKRKAPPGEATNAPPLRATRFVMAQAAERSDGGRPGPNPRLRHAQTAPPPGTRALLAVGGGRREAAEALRAMTARGARVWKRWARTAGMSKGSSRRLRLRVGDGGEGPRRRQVGYRRGWFRSARWFGIDGVLVPRDSNWPSLLLRTSEGVLQADFESEAAQAAALVALAAGLAAAPAGAPLAEVPCPPAIRFLPPAT